jgi:hypothetical protein
LWAIHFLKILDPPPKDSRRGSKFRSINVLRVLGPQPKDCRRGSRKVGQQCLEPGLVPCCGTLARHGPEGPLPCLGTPARHGPGTLRHFSEKVGSRRGASLVVERSERPRSQRPKGKQKVTKTEGHKDRKVNRKVTKTEGHRDRGHKDRMKR